MPTILPISDMHFEFHNDDGKEFIEKLSSDDVDILIVAGDMSNFKHIKRNAEALSNKFKNVIFVSGNHDQFGYLHEEVNKLKSSVNIANFHWLERESITIDGVKFVGCTLWFPRPDSEYGKSGYADFQYIPRFEPWVYGQHQESMDYLNKNLQEGDVLITHFMPFKSSILKQWEGSELNKFFWSGEASEEIIKKRKPRMVIHGHTHGSLWYHEDGVEVVCNPFGYIKYDMNPSYNQRKIIKL